MNLYLVFALTVLLGKTLTASPSIITIHAPPRAESCEYDGKTYKVNVKFKPRPCYTCQCYQAGNHYCSIKKCIPPPCVDPVPDFDGCCPVCGNGPNCYAPDGAVISAGEFYIIYSGAVCTCPPYRGHAVLNATCRLHVRYLTERPPQPYW